MHLEVIVQQQSIKDYYQGLQKQSSIHEGDAGVDLICPEEITIMPHSCGTIDFKINCQANDKDGKVSYLLVPRSSICKTPLIMHNSIGIIDSNYQGSIMAKVVNFGDDQYTIKKGDRLFQIVSFKGEPITVSLIDKFLYETSRGQGGFGSTGE